MIIQADAIEFLRSQPAGSVDLVFSSPPYEEARLYLEGGENLGVARKTEAWVAWMVEVFKAGLHACKGLVAFVVEGQTRQFRYSAGPALLMADLHRAGVHLRKPPIFHRIGIPGSGGPDWLRNDWEWIVCATNGGKLPWSDNTACGHAPKWAPGGEMSHRLATGARVNQWGKPVDANGNCSGQANDIEPGKKAAVQKRPSHKFMSMTSRGTNGERKIAGGRRAPTGRNGGDVTHDDVYDPPAVANPGNNIEDAIALPELVSILSAYGNATKRDAGAVLHELRKAIDAQKISSWFRGIYTALRGETILRPDLYGAGEQDVADLRHLPGVREALYADLSWKSVLQQAMLPEFHAGNQSAQSKKGQQAETKDNMRKVRIDQTITHPPQRQESIQQRSEELGNSLQFLSQQGTQSEKNVFNLQEAADGARLLSKAFVPIQKVWQSTLFEAFAAQSANSCEQLSDWFHTIVGGGVMGGDAFSSQNEAPFPESLCEFFVKSFCPPGGVCCDPFSGSGTTGAVSVRNGRKFIGCDLRPSQVDLGNRRIEQETPLGLFSAP